MKKPTIQLSLNSKYALDNITFYQEQTNNTLFFVSRLHYGKFEKKKIIVKTDYENGLVTLSKNIINFRIYKDSEINNIFLVLKNKKRIPIKKFKKWVKTTSKLEVVNKFKKKESSSLYFDL